MLRFIKNLFSRKSPNRAFRTASVNYWVEAPLTESEREDAIQAMSEINRREDYPNKITIFTFHFADRDPVVLKARTVIPGEDYVFKCTREDRDAYEIHPSD